MNCMIFGVEFFEIKIYNTICEFVIAEDTYTHKTRLTFHSIMNSWVKRLALSPLHSKMHGGGSERKPVEATFKNHFGAIKLGVLAV